MGTLLNRRRYMGGGGGLPYDAEIEYLESSGTQYIDTGIYIKGLTSELRMKYSAYTDVYFVCGCRTAYNNKAFMFGNGGGNYATYNRYFLNYNNGYDAWQTCPNDENIHDLVMTNVVKVDGTTIKTFYSSDFTTGKTLWLFGSNNNDGARYGSMKIYSVQIYDNNILVRDYIPVRVGQVGYMYDKVSRELFGNNGSGSFILGSDKTI